MDSELPHCTICLKPTTGGWRCPEHTDFISIDASTPTMIKDKQQLTIIELQTLGSFLKDVNPPASKIATLGAEAIQSLLVENERLEALVEKLQTGNRARFEANAYCNVCHGPCKRKPRHGESQW